MVSMVLEERDGESVGLLGAYLIVGSGVEQRYTFLSFFFFWEEKRYTSFLVSILFLKFII